MLYKDIADYKSSVKDIDKVLEAFPDFASAWFMRSENLRLMGDRKSAERDYKKSLALSKKPMKSNEKASEVEAEEPEETQEDVANRFTSLLTIENNTTVKEDYNTEGIKGRVQDFNVTIDVEPMFTLSYYVTTTEIKERPYYIKEIDDVNATRMLRFVVMLTNHEPQLNDEDAINRHFASIDYYTSYMSTHAERAIDYFGRAMDYYTLHNYQAAIADLDRAIEITPDFTLAYMLRANARRKMNEFDHNNKGEMTAAAARLSEQEMRVANQQIMADIDKVIELSPRMAFAYFNKGSLLLAAGDLTTALSAFSKAIELKPDLGEAYYNRGYINMRLGNREAGVADLSKAGELGIVPSYNLLKRMNR
jgi:tetratricopeptide (TPR) repeat protein